MREEIARLIVEDEVRDILESCVSVSVPKNKKEICELCFCQETAGTFDVCYEVPGKGLVKEADVVHCKNGVSVNYTEDYMRRRDPNSMVIGDAKETDKPRYKDLYGRDFEIMRKETFDWLKKQELIVVPFMAGGKEYGYPALFIAPKNAAFFCAALIDIQGVCEMKPGKDFVPRAVIYVAPPFRHTHFGGKQIVVHNRRDKVHECFSYNLYPGPSAKKGVYAVLLDIGEQEGWLTAHASTVKTISPYKNQIVIMHEGASGGGKSEMLQYMNRERDGKICVANNVVTGDRILFEIKDVCELRPITDDMALCHPKMQNGSKKMVIADAENAWFMRFDGVTSYGCDPFFEKICTEPSEPLIFLNLQGVANATCLIWEHTVDSNGKRCPNPRAILPRHMVPGIINEPVEVNVRTFGVRMPPCTKTRPSYGIVGLFHVLPPALAWLWRLVAPRGFNNPSIINATNDITSEGVGSYWPFATGKKVTQANLLLQQFLDYPKTRYLLVPNQHVGAYNVKFMAEHLMREFIARRNGADFEKEYLIESRCPLLGYTVNEVKVEGNSVPQTLLRPEIQPEIGTEAYDKGAAILTSFFKKEIEQFLTPELDPLGRRIIEVCLRDGSINDYLKLIPMRKLPAKKK